MNKYFAKYLILERELRIGDYVNQEGSFIEIKDEENRIAAELFDKVPCKLFLCSNEIQVGDKVICLRTARTGDIELRTEGKYYYTCEINVQLNKEENFKSWGYINNQGQKQYIHYPEEMCKVIGEISPEAIWVKEGDTFDESQISIEYYEKPQFIDNNLRRNRLVNPIIKLQCSQCNTFH